MTLVTAPAPRNAATGTVLAILCLVPLVGGIALVLAHPALRPALIGALPLLLRYAETVLAPAALAWVGARAAGHRIDPASAVLAVALAGLGGFAGLGATAALALFVAASLAIGAWLLSRPDDDAGAVATATLGGAGLVVGTLGWLLPLPVHGPLTWIPALAAVVLLGRVRAATACRTLLAGWVQATRSAAGAATFAACLLGLASVLCWMPSLNPDDNAGHFALWRELAAFGHYRMDASGFVFALAPWFNNAMHGLLAVLAGGDARAAVGAWWLAVGAVGAYRLSRLLGADRTISWLAVAVYASHPLTAYFGMTLQVDGASAACLLHLGAACVQARDPAARPNGMLLGALFGLLAALKVTNLAFVALAGGWLAVGMLRARQWRALGAVLGSATWVGLSSYAYAWLVSGNPLLPLFNGVFKSPYMAAQDFGDPRWHAGVHLSTPWDMTVATSTFMEAYPGGAGLVLVALAGGALAACIGDRRRAALVALGLAGTLAVLFQVQYLRYVFPGIVLLSTLAVVAIGAYAPRRAAIVLLAGLALAQAGLVRTTSWILNAGAADDLLASGPSSRASIDRHFVPEKILVARVADRTAGRFCLLFSDPARPYIALAPGRSLTVGFYDRRMSTMAEWAEADPTGARWSTALSGIGVTHVENRPGAVSPPLQLALEAGGFTITDQLGEAQVWTREGGNPERCLAGTFKPRDEAKRLIKW